MKTDKKKKSYHIAEVIGDTEPVPAPKRAYNRKPKMEPAEFVDKGKPKEIPVSIELNAAYAMLKRSNKDVYDLHMRYNKFVTLLAISTSLNVVLMIGLALAIFGVE